MGQVHRPAAAQQVQWVRTGHPGHGPLQSAGGLHSFPNYSLSCFFANLMLLYTVSAFALGQPGLPELQLQKMLQIFTSTAGCPATFCLLNPTPCCTEPSLMLLLQTS